MSKNLPFFISSFASLFFSVKARWWRNHSEFVHTKIPAQSHNKSSLLSSNKSWLSFSTDFPTWKIVKIYSNETRKSMSINFEEWNIETLPKAIRTQALTALTSNFGLVWWVLFGKFQLGKSAIKTCSSSHSHFPVAMCDSENIVWVLEKLDECWRIV